jgi:SAM-dependent methyltransferase
MPPKKPAEAVHTFDRLYGTDTSGLIAGRVIARGTSAKVAELTAYYGVAPSILSGLLDRWLQELRPQAPIEKTVFYDVGAGKGRACLLASRYPFLRVEGIELSPALASIANANAELWSRTTEALAPIALHHGDATLHTLPAEPTLAFLFHPFELPLLRRFLRHIERSRAVTSAPLDLIYANAEHDSFLDHHPAFTRLWMGRVPMSPADHLADLEAIALQKEYGSTGDELCAIYRFHPRKASKPVRKKAAK